MAQAVSRGAARWLGDPGVVATVALGVSLAGFALSVDFPRASQGFKGDEATYYALTYSLARDFDLEYRRADLLRVWEEYPSGPQGIFLKKGRTVSIRAVPRFPFVDVAKGPDPQADRRLFYGKAYLYPLVAAPFVGLFGTNGFLVLHALLLTLDFAAAYLLLVARGSVPGWAVAYALVFFGASVVPVYFVWLSPELFNLSLVMYAALLWSYKELETVSAGPDWLQRMLRSPWSDLGAAVLVGAATFAKPTHGVLALPLVALAALRRQWWRAGGVAAVTAGVASALFVVNLVVTGDANYQGGERKTCYSPPPGSTYVGRVGFPFARPGDTFETTCLEQATDDVPVDILVTRDTLRVFRHNVVYFLVGRSSGLVPYFFPGVVSLALFVAALHRARRWQWLVLGTLAAGATGLLLYMPYTYSGGGGPIGNRYFLSFYPLFLLLTPPLGSGGGPVVAAAVGAVFTAKLVLNPFVASRHPGDHAKAGPLRWLPIELTTINDLAVAARADRGRLPVGGDPPMLAYFPDDNVYGLEGDGFWVRGKARAEIILRAPARTVEGGVVVPLRLSRLTVELTNGGASNRVTLGAGRGRRTVELGPFEARRVELDVPFGVPYRPARYPTNYAYVLSVATTAGFVPYLEQPPSLDSRYLGVMIRLSPVYVEAR